MSSERDGKRVGWRMGSKSLGYTNGMIGTETGRHEWNGRRGGERETVEGGVRWELGCSGERAGVNCKGEKTWWSE